MRKYITKSRVEDYNELSEIICNGCGKSVPTENPIWNNTGYLLGINNTSADLCLSCLEIITKDFTVPMEQKEY